MTSGSATNTIAIQLQQLLRKINNQLLASFASPQSVAQHEMAGNTLINDLQNWQHQLEMFQRRLRQIDHQLASREQRVHGLQRTQRYRERQSIGSGRDSLDQAEDLAAEVRRRLKQLVHRTLIPGDVEAINKGFDLLDDAAKEMIEFQQLIEKASRAGNISHHDATQLRTIVSEGGAVYQNMPKSQAAGPDWLVMLTLIVRLAHMAVLSRRNRNNR